MLQSLLQELLSTQCPYSHSVVLGLERHLTFRLVQDWRTWSPQHNSIAARFAPLARALEYRNTSKRSDELMCMASILGLPTKAILEADSSEDRAVAFYKTLKTVPISILFCNGLRISKRPFRWALASLISPEDPRKLQTLSKTTNHFGQCEANGLHVRASGIFFEIDHNETMVDFNRLWIKPDRLSLEPLGWGFPSQVPPWQSWSEIRQARTAGDKLVLMINPSCDHEGVILKAVGKSSQTFFVEYLTQVHIRYVGKRHSLDKGPIWRQESSSEDESEAGSPRWAGVDGPFPAGSPDWERRSISAWRRLRTSESQKWVIT